MRNALALIVGLAIAMGVCLAAGWAVGLPWTRSATIGAVVCAVIFVLWFSLVRKANQSQR
ncbi:hypothetical protein H4P1_00060 (plasmid) [Variovorax sp. PBS-H4]|nr:hypothetical protein H4P1_00060 [Variovorax sp. PBS-H4]